MRKNFILFIAVMLTAGAIIVSCKGKKPATKPVKGVLEEAVREGSASELVNATMERQDRKSVV